MRHDGLRTARWIALLLPAALLAGAWGSQLFGLVPCEMCHWQRWPHYAALPFAALAFASMPRPARLLLVLIAAALIAVSGAIGVLHAGVEYHWWPGFTPCTAPVGHGDAMEMLTQALRRPFVRCDVPQWTLFGISLAGFNAILSLGGALTILVLSLRRPRG